MGAASWPCEYEVRPGATMRFDALFDSFPGDLTLRPHRTIAQAGFARTTRKKTPPIGRRSGSSYSVKRFLAETDEDRGPGCSPTRRAGIALRRYFFTKPIFFISAFLATASTLASTS